MDFKATQKDKEDLIKANTDIVKRQIIAIEQC